MSRDPRLSKSEVFLSSPLPAQGNASKETIKPDFAPVSEEKLLDSVKNRLKSPFAEVAVREAAPHAILEKLSREERDTLAMMMVAAMITPGHWLLAQQEHEEALAGAYMLLLPEVFAHLNTARELSHPATPSSSRDMAATTRTPENAIPHAPPIVETAHSASTTFHELPSPSLSANNLGPPIEPPVVREPPQPTSQSTPNAHDRPRNEPVPDSEITIVSQHRSGVGHENAINFKQRDGGFDSIAAGTFDNGQSASGTQAFSIGQGLSLKAGDVASSITMATVAETGSPDEIAIRYRIKHAPQGPTNDAVSPSAPAIAHSSEPPPSPTAPPPGLYRRASWEQHFPDQSIAPPPPPIAASPPRFDQVAGSPTRGAEAPTRQEGLSSNAEKSARPRRGVINGNAVQAKPGFLRRFLHTAGLRVSGIVRYNAIEGRATGSPVQLSAKKEPFALDAGTIQGSLSKGVTRRELLKQFTQERGVPFPERSRARESPGQGH